MRLSNSWCLLLYSSIHLFFCVYAAFADYPPNMRRLRCMTCVPSAGDTTQLDQFRVRQKLMEPRCEMEPVLCRAEQDACATITMQVALNRFWVGAGCDQRVNYDIPADRHGCAEMATLTRNWLPGYIEERRAIQKICICTGDLCNTASTKLAFLNLSNFLILIFAQKIIQQVFVR